MRGMFALVVLAIVTPSGSVKPLVREGGDGLIDSGALPALIQSGASAGRRDHIKSMEEKVMKLATKKGSPEVVRIIEDIKPMIETVNEQVNQSHTLHQTELDKLHDHFEDSCEVILKDSTQNLKVLKQSYTSFSVTHKQCRVDESDAWVIANDIKTQLDLLRATETRECELLKTYKEAALDKDNHRKQVQRDAVPGQSNDEYICRCAEYITGLKQNVSQAQDKCKDASELAAAKQTEYDAAATAHKAKRTSCETVQVSMDHAACSYASETREVCQAYSNCFESQKITYSEAKKEALVAASDRQGEWKALTKISCILLTIDSSTKSVDQCDHDDTIDVSHLELEIKEVPVQTPCVPETVYPYNPAYVTREFSMLPPHTSATRATPCSLCVDNPDFTFPCQEHGLETGVLSNCTFLTSAQVPAQIKDGYYCKQDETTEYDIKGNCAATCSSC